ncbi:putative callose synthase 8 [Senna tora]|uniref:1,3-beta-glucan synthase n=1 Tax=Senna tora TaxID=362788 RepID=A0A835CCE8_9FABA|nr:putative callose synthase 8 [Senna tora]
MSEIVPAEPIDDRTRFRDETRFGKSHFEEGETSYARPNVTLAITSGPSHVDDVPEPFDSERLPTIFGSEIQRFLRVANLIEREEPRVAYLCRFHAFVIAHTLDKNSSGRGVRQFKTSLLQRLEQDEEVTIRKRKDKSDSRELKRVYHAYRDYFIKHDKTFDLDHSHREKLINARNIASVLFEALIEGNEIHKKSEFNILPLEQGGIQHAIMQQPEIKAAIAAICNTRGLPSPQDFKKNGTFIDLFDFLQHCFGFQVANVANQREHLILLLANMQTRQTQKQTSILKLGEGCVDELMRKFFKNYTNWCKFLGRKSNIRLPFVKQEAQQYKILYIGLYLLIWGEAANLRFMPECLCYIFHQMAYELHGVLSGAISLTTWEKVMPAYGGESDSYLNNVITPIYRVIREEAAKSKGGTADHSLWRNYDDLNEYFWSPQCFSIGWPMRLDHAFFCVHPTKKSNVKNAIVSPDNIKERKKSSKKDEESEDKSDECHEPQWLGKTNFVEIRSFWQLFRSFDRMWSFFIISLQATIIMACHDLGSPLQLFDAIVFEDIISIFITSAILKLIQAILDIIFTWKARLTMEYSQKLKLLTKLVVALIWTIILPVCYANSRRKYTCYSTQYGSLVEEWCFTSYMIASAIYLMSNAVETVLFFLPAVAKYIEVSNNQICRVLSWWTQPRIYVGRGMQENQVSVLKYTLFWILVLSSKFLFSYSFEIKPLIAPTREIMKIGVRKYDWHELFPKVKSNAGAIVAVWTPIVIVYFMDTQIWYSVFCTIFGGLYGILHHLGEIRTLGMLRSRFDSFPHAFNVCLIPPSSKAGRKKRKGLLSNIFQKMPIEKNASAKFVAVWNQIISHLRLEDLISNREMDLMMMPMSSELFSGRVRWPVFLLANKFSTALSIAKDFEGKDEILFKKIKKDKYMYYAVKECYESLKYVLEILVVGHLEKRIICAILNEIEESINGSSLLKNFKMKMLPALQAKFIELAELLIDGDKNHQCKVVKAVQDIFELVTNDMMVNSSKIMDMLEFPLPDGSNFIYLHRDIGQLLFAHEEMDRDIEPLLFANRNSIHFPLPESGTLFEKVKLLSTILAFHSPFMSRLLYFYTEVKVSSSGHEKTFGMCILTHLCAHERIQSIKRFHLLLTVKDTAMDVPANIEARRRISFFATSLFADMPDAPKVRNMLSFSVITPHYIEDINFSLEELHSSQEEVSIIFYMQKIFPDEWKNFLERIGCEDLEDLGEDQKKEELRQWASFRGQTLSRTARGMMYYREALKLQAFLDMAEDEDILEGYETAERGNAALFAHLEALADMKYTYVISCQSFASQKASGDPHAQDIIDLMKKYPSLRVAYVDEKEEIVQGKPHKVYSSNLVKVVNGYEQVIYSIKLPGPPDIGEGKPENQNHAIIFTRGEALQTIDMNQDNYLEEALKMRNLLQEFLQCQGRRPPTILGLREHIFTGSVSSLAWFMSYQETSFVTIGQRILANPLRVRFHYGHPDVFDRVFHITRGGISKASKTINLSEDVFAGFNSTLRRGCISYHEYLQVGKGRDVGLNQISKFEAKVANGNSEQTISRDVFRLGRQFDFFRMLSCYFTTTGFYFSNLISVIGIYVFLYGQLYLVLSGLERALIIEARIKNVQSLETALASQSFIQLGLLTGLPMVMEIGLEKGFLTALKDFVLMQLQLAAVFFTFSLGTKIHYYGRTILHGGAKYRPTGRKVVVFHSSFTENYRLYSRSHFVKGFELMLLLIVYNMFRRSYQSSVAYVLITYAIWFMSLTWLCAPFLFNPAGFSWAKTVDDWKEWNKWIRQQGGIGIQQDKSWHSWWDDEQAHLRRSGLRSRLIEILLSLRFFIYQYGLVYHLDISQHSKNFLVYVLSWVVILAVFLLVKAVNMGRQLFSANYQLGFRFFKAFLFVGVLSIIITLSIICELSLMDLFVCCLAFMPTAWGLILISQAVRPKIEHTGIWDFTRALARAYDYGMGVVLFTPIAILAWLPIIKAFHARILFNEAFKRHLQIQPILAGKKKEHKS